MRRLFVDVDDTLIHWLGRLDEESGEECWEVNQHVLDFVQWWPTAFDGGIVVVWSAGGKEYAKQWAERVMPEGFAYHTAEKKCFPATRDDAFIDNDPWPCFYKGEVAHPNDLIGAVQ